MDNTKKAGFGGLDIRRTPAGTEVIVKAERPGMVIGRKGKIINDLQKQLDERFSIENPKLKVDEVEDPALNAQVMAEKIASAMERGWYYRRAGHSAALNIMEAGARGVIITLAGKLTGSRNRTQKFIRGHVKYCGETALEHMDRLLRMYQEIGNNWSNCSNYAKGYKTTPRDLNLFRRAT